MEYNENPTYINIFQNGAAQSKRLLELSLEVQRGDTLQTPIYMKRSIPGEKDKFAVSYDFLLSRRVFLA